MPPTILAGLLRGCATPSRLQLFRGEWISGPRYRSTNAGLHSNSSVSTQVLRRTSRHTRRVFISEDPNGVIIAANRRQVIVEEQCRRPKWSFFRSLGTVCSRERVSQFDLAGRGACCLYATRLVVVSPMILQRALD